MSDPAPVQPVQAVRAVTPSKREAQQTVKTEKTVERMLRFVQSGRLKEVDDLGLIGAFFTIVDAAKHEFMHDMMEVEDDEPERAAQPPA